MILSTSDIKTYSTPPRSRFKTFFVYLLVSVLVVLFSFIYELFSHQVYSCFMIYAFVFPLIGGAIPFLVIELFPTAIYPKAVSRNLYHSGIATLTMGSLMQGVLEIYGTTNSLMVVYWIIGIAMTAIGIITFLIQHIAHR